MNRPVTSSARTQAPRTAAPVIAVRPAIDSGPVEPASDRLRNVVEVAPESVSVDGKLIYQLGRERFPLSPTWRERNRPLARALNDGLDHAEEVWLTSEPDVTFLSVGRVIDGLLSSGWDTVSMRIETIPIKVALAEGRPRPEEDGLWLIIVTDGVSLQGPGGNLAPGCSGVGPGLAVKRESGEIDYAALRDCVVRIVGSDVAAHSKLRSVSLTANPGVPFREIVDVTHALTAAGAHLVGLRVM